MPQFFVDDDLAALVERLAKPKPFENLSFNAALKRVLQQYTELSQKAAVSGKKDVGESDDDLDQLLRESMYLAQKASKKAPSPSAAAWAASVPELKDQKGLSSWKAICQLLEVEAAGDSARRKLQYWVKQNHPSWPEVPGLEANE